MPPNIAQFADNHTIMMNIRLNNLACLTLVALFCASISGFADDLEKLAGSWSTKKTNDQGQAFTQVLEIKKDKLVFKILGGGEQLFLYAEGTVKLEKFGPFNGIRVTNVKGGISESDLQPVEEDFVSIYHLDSDTLRMAANFDKERDQKPSLDVYQRVKN
jgi:hypothetical protein